MWDSGYKNPMTEYLGIIALVTGFAVFVIFAASKLCEGIMLIPLP
ncbi:hypothetical protein [Limibacillus sp. MBR-115]|jgi:hypothetical protein